LVTGEKVDKRRGGKGHKEQMEESHIVKIVLKNMAEGSNSLK